MALSIVPALWDRFIAEAVIAKNNVLTMGMVQVERAVFPTGGQTWSRPKLAPINETDDDTRITSSSTLTPEALTDYNEIQTICYREKGWTNSYYYKYAQGLDLLNEVGPQIANYILEQAQRFLVACTAGAFASGGALVSTHQYDGSAGLITFEQIANAALLMGEKMETLTGIVMHSKVANDAYQSGLLTYAAIPVIAGTIMQSGQLPVIMGKRVWINDTMCANDGGSPAIYPTYLVGGQPWYLGYQTQEIATNERKLTAGGTLDLIARWNISPHIKGLSYGGAVNPETTTLDDAGSWTLVAKAKNVKLVSLLTQ